MVPSVEVTAEENVVACVQGSRVRQGDDRKALLAALGFGGLHGAAWAFSFVSQYLPLVSPGISFVGSKEG